MVFPLRILIGNPLASSHLDKSLHEPLMSDAVFLKQLGGGAFSLTECQEIVLCGKELILQLGHFLFSSIDRLAELITHKGLGAAMHLGKACSC